jgi:hypothetical protein
MSYATGLNYFTSQYSLNIYIYFSRLCRWCIINVWGKKNRTGGTVFSMWPVPRLYNEDQRELTKATRTIGIICSAKPVLTEDLCIVQKEEFLVTCYMCDMYT